MTQGQVLFASMVLISSVLLPSFASAQAAPWESSEDIWRHERLATTTPEGVVVTFSIHATAKAWPLVGEPVVFCQFAISDVKIQKAEFDGRKESPYYAVPGSALEKAFQIWGVEFEFDLDVSGKYRSFSCDPGVAGNTFAGSYLEFDQLPNKEKSKYASFNVPASPSWGKFIREAQFSERFASESQSKSIFNGVLKPNGYARIQGFNKGFSPSFDAFEVRYKTAFDMTKVPQVRYVAEKVVEDAKATQRTVEAAGQKRRQRLADHAANKRSVEGAKVAGGGDPFWSSPEDVLTPQETETKQKAAQTEAKAMKSLRTGTNTAAIASKHRSEVESRLPRIKELTCQNSKQAYDQCIVKTCGGYPFRPLGTILQSKCLYCPEPTEAQKRRAREARRREAEREEREFQQRVDAWNRCVTSARPRCEKSGTSDVQACIRNFQP